MAAFIRGWAITVWAAIVIGAMVAAILLAQGVSENGLHIVIRSTAQTSFALFTAAFVASPLFALWPTSLTRWLRSNRRYIGVSFAVSHLFHAAGIITLAVVTSGASLKEADMITFTGGLITYLLIIAMAATSFDGAVRRLGAKRWKALHKTGMYMLWVNFMVAYGGRAFFSVLYVPFALLIVAAIAFRIIAYNARGFKSKAVGV